MTEICCLEPAYSTTRQLTRKTPIVVNPPDAKFKQGLILPEGENRKGEGGLRTQRYFKMSLPDKPLITVITVVFNGEKHLEDTILSVLNQSYDNIEYIIIDGGSTDGTIDIIKKYDGQIDYWVSEKDNGLYYAMNKGLFLAAGDWVNFMNCGDSFFEKNTIDTIFKCKNRDGVIYGDVMFSFDGTSSVYVKAKELVHFWKGMQFVHQASFVSSDLMRKFPFDTSYKLIADYNSLYQIYLSHADFTHISLPICNFLAGGLSDNNPETICECKKMIFKIHSNINIKLYYHFKYVECFTKYNMAKYMGQANYAFLRVAKSKLLNLLGR